MVPEPSLSRRRLLAGAGAAAGAGLVGAGAFAPTWLPDALTDELLTLYPEPPGHVRRPAVSDDHADAAVARLEATVERAETLRARVDLDAVPENLRFRLDGGDPSGGWLETARNESDPRERLFDATYGMQFAGEVVGAAKAALDEVNPEALVERGDRLRTAAADVRDSLGDYPVSDPATDLARVYFVEKELSIARLNSHRDGVSTGGVADAEDYSAHDVASTWGSHVQAEQRVENARYYRDRYRERLGSDPRPYAATLKEALSTLTDEIESYPTRNEMRERIGEDRDLTQETPYGAARWELWTLCFDDDFRFGFDADGYRPGHAVQRAVETAWALMDRRAHGFALDELGVEPGDAGYDAGRAFAAKRRAVRRFRSARDEFDSPLAGLLAQRAADRIRAGDVGVKLSDGSRPGWQPRVEATTYYLVGEAHARGLGDAFGTIVPDGG